MNLVCSPPSTTNYTTIAQELEGLVRGRAGTRVRNLRVEVLDDEVILFGRASSYYAKQLATHAVLHPAAPRTLTNSIEVV